ncbi:unnamed protein product, partial [Meganyctiphanes norvegica]
MWVGGIVFDIYVISILLVPEVKYRYDYIGNIEVDLGTPLREVSSKFLSVGLEPWLMRNDWEKFNTSSLLLQTLVGGLAPAVLRMGGTSANFLTYDPDASYDRDVYGYQELSNQYFTNLNNYEVKDFSNFTMTGQDLSDLLDFVEVVNMSLLWDVNQFYRDPLGTWDPTNAHLIMQEISKRKQTVLWQLGNEPNIYDHHNDFSITGQQDALDYATFREELHKVFPEVTVVGPDVTNPKVKVNCIADDKEVRSNSVVFLREFLTYGAQDLDVVSWHHYYGGGDVTIDDFLDPALMNNLTNQLEQMVAVRNELGPNLPMWLTETSTFYGGGAPDMSNRYVAGFLWMDKLGLAAQTGIDLVVRESLYHGSYSLLSPDLQPNPDYWMSVIYKQQVGGRVLDLQLNTTTPTVRLYANCLSTSSQHYKKGAIVLYGMNTGEESALVRLGEGIDDTEVLEMLLQPTDGDLQSRSVMLNDVVVELTTQETLPPLDAWPSGVFGGLNIPPRTMGFWLLPEADAQACQY